MQELPLNGFYESTTTKNSVRRCVNLIPINEPSGGLSQNMLECPSGLSQIGPVEAASGSLELDYSSAVSGEITSQTAQSLDSPSVLLPSAGRSAMIVPYDNYLIFYTGDTGKPLKEDYADGFGYARIASSQSDTVILSPAYAGGVVPNDPFGLNGSYCRIEYGFVISGVDVYSEFTGPTFHDIAYAGGRMVWVDYSDASDSSSTRYRCYYSDIGDVVPLNTRFFSPDTSVSRLTGIHNLNGSLWVFDADNAFLFTITSSVTTPFQWQRAATQAVGCAGPHAKAEVKGILYTLGRVENGSYSVVALTQGRVSTPAVDALIREKISTLSEFEIFKQVKLFGYRDKGRDILAVTVADLTLCYNVTDGRWFEMGDGDKWEVCGYGTVYGQDVFIGRTITVSGSDITFNMSQPDLTIGTEFGETVERYFESGMFNAQQAPIRLAELEPQVQVVGSDAEDVFVSVSTDFGETYGTERSSTVVSGDRRTRFMNWGLVRQAFVVKVRFLNDYPSKIVRLMSRLITGGRDA